MVLLAKYNTQTVFTFPVVKRDVVDLATSSDWTPATGDTKISKDGGNVANSTNNPSAVGGTGSVLWTLTLTATELQAAVVDVQIVDSATKVIEDQVLKIYTYGNASAKIPVDLSNTTSLGLSNLDTALSTIAGYIDTEVAAIKAKTDNLPSDPADASDIAASFSTVNTTLSTLAGYVDTEVAAIKAKTDNLPAAPAATADIPNVDSIAAAIAALDLTGLSWALTLRAIRAACAGKTSGGGSATIQFYDVDGETVVLTATVDGSDRTNVAIDGA